MGKGTVERIYLIKSFKTDIFKAFPVVKVVMLRLNVDMLSEYISVFKDATVYANEDLPEPVGKLLREKKIIPKRFEEIVLSPTSVLVECSESGIVLIIVEGVGFLMRRIFG